jgi:hypothetical protein
MGLELASIQVKLVEVIEDFFKVTCMNSCVVLKLGLGRWSDWTTRATKEFLNITNLVSINKNGYKSTSWGTGAFRGVLRIFNRVMLALSRFSGPVDWGR